MLLLLTLVLAAADAEELWVRNRRFHGEVQGSGTTMLVELRRLTKALDLKLHRRGEGWALAPGDDEVPAGSVLVRGKTLPLTAGQEGPLVSVAAFAEAVGGVLKRNSELGTIDLYLPEETAEAAGDWEEPASSSDDSLSKDRVYGNPAAGYTVEVPRGIYLSADKQFMTQVNTYLSGQLPSSSSEMVSLEFFLTYQNNRYRNAAGMLMLLRLPLKEEVDDETLNKILASALARQRAVVIKGPEVTRVNGRKFTEAEFTVIEGDKVGRGRAFLHLNQARKLGYFYQLIDDDETFKNSSGKLLKVFKSLEIKDL